jgi:hypothetical protein
MNAPIETTTPQPGSLHRLVMLLCEERWKYDANAKACYAKGDAENGYGWRCKAAGMAEAVALVQMWTEQHNVELSNSRPK